MNLSNKKFSKAEYNLLNKNLNFCPSPGKYNKKTFEKDIDAFTRRIKLKAHFNNNDDSDSNTNKKDFYIKGNSTWTPHNPHHTIKTFIEAFSNEIKDLPDTTVNNRKKNLKKSELKALEDFQQREEIVITKTDKGGAVVIQDVSDYINEAKRQLSDQNFYTKCSKDLTYEHNRKVNTTIDSLKKSNLLTEKTANMLKTNNPKTPKFYTLPKIHKENNPGRPVISSINCHTANLSKFVDYHLQEHVTKTSSYVKDTTDFLNKTKDINVPPNSLLVTMDVKSLYTNIPNGEGLSAINDTLKNSNTPTSLKTVILTFLELILTLNNFIFNSEHYLQIKGCAMGTKCAPSYANLFMDNFETKYIYPTTRLKTKLYLRFIDDIFMLWTGTLEDLKNFELAINEIHHSIKLTFDYSYESINFLDTTVIITPSGRLETKIFKKPTDRSNYLHNTSYHPSPLKNNIPYGQALRLKKICSNNDDYVTSLNELKSAFLKRGYQEHHLTQQFEKASLIDRSNLLRYQGKNEQQNSQLLFITTYNKSLPRIKSAFDKHWNLLQINEELKQAFTHSPKLVYRRNKNLRDFIGQTTIKNNKVQKRKELKPGKCRPCLTSIRNLCCRQITSTSSFTSSQTGKDFKIYHNTTCRSKNIIYLMECRKCKTQYVGKSETAFNIRLNNHRSNGYKPTNDSIPACKHFHGNGHDFTRDAKFTIIEQIKDANQKPQEEISRIILQRENFWITKLKTLTPLGFNQELN